MSLGRSRYFVVVIEDYTWQTWIYIIAKKSEVFHYFRNLKNLVEREIRRKIKFLQSDGGKEYFSVQYTSYLQQMGIRREFSCRYMPEQNGLAERKNRSVVEAAREMLEEKSWPKFYWAEVVRTAVYIQNRIREKVLAHELHFRRKLNLRNLRVFRSIAYVHVSKLDAKGEKCILVCYSDEQKRYKCYNPPNQTNLDKSRCCVR